MEQLAGTKLVVSFKLRLLDNTLMTAERSFYIQQ